MRLHTNTHTPHTIELALVRAQQAGKVASHVFIDECEERGSRKRKRAYEISLRAFNKLDGDKRRRPNQNTGERDLWAATYDEWGWFIAELFATEPGLIFGQYDGRHGFDEYTRCKYILDTAA